MREVLLDMKSNNVKISTANIVAQCYRQHLDFNSGLATVAEALKDGSLTDSDLTDPLLDIIKARSNGAPRSSGLVTSP